ncbi:hypothetical protein [Candidatus Electronema sp. JC]|uniref:hypothetical protein n=1 Tax=Candidatus Electronema sp. JC TaxID=3401570 RepID=UPI003AA80A4B
MEFFKHTAQLLWDETVKAVAALLAAMFLPALLDRAKSAWGVVGGRLADFGWWKRESVLAV